MSALLFAWLAEAGILTFRVATRGRPGHPGQKIPWPADYAATFVIYGGLSLIAEAGPNAANVSAAFGWALVLATILNLYDPNTISISPSGQFTKGGKSTGRTARPVPQPGFTQGVA